MLTLVATLAVVGCGFAAEMEGTIRSIDTASKELALDNGSKIVLDDATTISVEGKEGKLEDLKEGSQSQSQL